MFTTVIYSELVIIVNFSPKSDQIYIIILAYYSMKNKYNWIFLNLCMELELFFETMHSNYS